MILNFHGIGPTSKNLSEGEQSCWLDLGFFESILDLVCQHPNVRLTVDDGNLSDFEIILPSLLKRSLRATFFICSGRLGQPGFLTRFHVQELQANGMSIGSHGVHHRPWRHLSSSELYKETAESRHVLENLCDRAVESAACPFGSYDRAVLRALRRGGYRSIYTSDGGRSREGSWIQPRTTLTRSMTLSQIKQLIQRGPGTCKQFLIDIRKVLKRLR